MTIAVPDDISFEDLGRIIDISIGADDEQYGNTGRFRVLSSDQVLMHRSMKGRVGDIYGCHVLIMTLAGVRMEYIPDDNGASKYLLEWLGRAPAEQIPSVIGHCDEKTPGSEDVNRRLREGWHRTWDVIPSETLERIAETFRTVDRRNPYHYYDTSTGRILSSKKDLRPEPNLVRIRTWKDRLDRVLGATFSTRFCRFGANLCDFNMAAFEGSLAKLGELERWRKVYTDAVRGLTIAWAEANCLVPEVPEGWGRPAQPPGTAIVTGMYMCRKCSRLCRGTMDTSESLAEESVGRYPGMFRCSCGAITKMLEVETSCRRAMTYSDDGMDWRYRHRDIALELSSRKAKGNRKLNMRMERSRLAFEADLYRPCRSLLLVSRALCSRLQDPKSSQSIVDAAAMLCSYCLYDLAEPLLPVATENANGSYGRLLLANLLVDEKDQEEIQRFIGRMKTMGDVTDGYPESYAWMLAANTLAENERLDEALECCRRSASMLIDAIESDPFREPLLSSLLDVYTKYEAILCVLEKTDEGLAERMLEVFPATDGEPNSIRCLALMFNGMHYLFRGEMEDAAGNLSECIRLADGYIGINPTVDATLFCALLALFHINKDGKLVDRAEDIAERLACSSERSEDSNMMAIHEFAYATVNEMGVSRTRSVGETLGYSVREGGCVEPASPMLMWIVSTSVVE